MRAIWEWLVGGEGFAFSWEGLSRRRGRWVSGHRKEEQHMERPEVGR